MAKVRVHELARELGMTNREVLMTLKILGMDVKSHMSSVEDTLAGEIREKYKPRRKEQKVEGPNNEKNVNKQEETPKKKKNIIRVYHVKNASDGGRKKQGERRRGERRPGQGRNQNAGRGAAPSPRNQGEKPVENPEAAKSSAAGQQNTGAPRTGRPYQDRQGGRGEGQERQERRFDNRGDGQGRSQGRGGRFSDR